MNGHLEAIRARLAGLGYLTHLYVAPKVSEQYLILSGPGWGSDPERAIDMAAAAFEVELRVKAVTGTPDGVAIMLDRVRAELSPDGVATRLTVAGRSAWIGYARSEFIDVDRDALIEGTSLHPAFGVDSYTLTSEPA